MDISQREDDLIFFGKSADELVNKHPPLFLNFFVFSLSDFILLTKRVLFDLLDREFGRPLFLSQVILDEVHRDAVEPGAEG